MTVPSAVNGWASLRMKPDSVETADLEVMEITVFHAGNGEDPTLI
eukprot:CAMPEP_0114575524 /NCGR_PEP_ID=MMETSP0125-20121206/381_1 /TAXON_ID=485358 ORGANISM="Aristerostoma sp., Strain ATCC 50986" /NCGR_SAMPLE_ID=MMETSP0125 /ASSEMBLY_ACC=CAM_ASM_000245 /LENGTH=44 /DNA_ID= /DNA_START= /DNA_END= /DNA_ORIENTATION=